MMHPLYLPLRKVVLEVLLEKMHGFKTVIKLVISTDVFIFVVISSESIGRSES